MIGFQSNDREALDNLLLRLIRRSPDTVIEIIETMGVHDKLELLRELRVLAKLNINYMDEIYYIISQM